MAHCRPLQQRDRSTTALRGDGQLGHEVLRLPNGKLQTGWNAFAADGVRTGQ
jgi:hypothetical protein